MYNSDVFITDSDCTTPDQLRPSAEIDPIAERIANLQKRLEIELKVNY